MFVCIALGWMWLMIIVGVFEWTTGISIEFFVRRKCRILKAWRSALLCLWKVWLVLFAFSFIGTSRISSTIWFTTSCDKFNNFQFILVSNILQGFRCAWLIDKIPNMSILALLFTQSTKNMSKERKKNKNKQTNKCDCLHYCYRLFTPPPTVNSQQKKLCWAHKMPEN